MAEILPNSPNDVASRGVTNATLAQFKGLARQVVINIDDNFRPVIMDGLTLGGKSKVALVTDLEDLQSQISDRYENYGVLPADSFQNTYVTVQQLQSTSANLADYAGAAGQIVYNSETKKIHIMDGVTAGGIPLALKSDVDTLESNSVKTTEQTLTEDQQTQSLKNQGVIQAITELITENGGTVPTSLSENSVQTMSAEPEDPWADLV